MAYNARKIAPIDFKPSTGVGVSIPFSGEAVFNTTFTTQEAVKANLINYPKPIRNLFPYSYN